MCILDLLCSPEWRYYALAIEWAEAAIQVQNLYQIFYNVLLENF